MKNKTLLVLLLNLVAGLNLAYASGDCNGHGCNDDSIHVRSDSDSYADSDARAHADADADSYSDVRDSGNSNVDLGIDVEGSTATVGPVTAGGASISQDLAPEAGAEASVELGGPLVDDHSSTTYTEAVRVAPAFGTNCYEAMNASLLDKGFSIGAANVVCQALQVADVWFALSAVEPDPVVSKQYFDEGLKVMKKVTRLTNRKLAWNNVKSFFQEIGVPVGIVVLLL